MNTLLTSTHNRGASLSVSIVLHAALALSVAFVKPIGMPQSRHARTSIAIVSPPAPRVKEHRVSRIPARPQLPKRLAGVFVTPRLALRAPEPVVAIHAALPDVKLPASQIQSAPPPVVPSEPRIPQAPKSAFGEPIVAAVAAKPAPIQIREGEFAGTSMSADGGGSGRLRMYQDSGFGGTAAATAVVRSARQGPSSAGFGDAVAQAATPTHKPVAREQPESTPVEVTFKPRPKYTDEARAAKDEGEVAIETLFAASGEVRVVRILRGLPHGLNEMAIAAVQSIRFRPATRSGIPVDTTATVRMVFSLAY
jgi:TonB family protein